MCHIVFSRSFVNFVGHTGGNIDYLAPFWAFPDNNSNLNKWIDMKWHAYLLGARKRFPVVFGGHLSNFKLARDEKSIWILFEIATVRSLKFALLWFVSVYRETNPWIFCINHIRWSVSHAKFIFNQYFFHYCIPLSNIDRNMSIPWFKDEFVISVTKKIRLK